MDKATARAIQKAKRAHPAGKKLRPVLKAVKECEFCGRTDGLHDNEYCFK